ncbi:hypothetical protein SAMN05660909_01002 [Chitinophaga terrae (ex Kim and Jung 2007)]|uniref:Uncharacterized protein n=1 Tax=Chitinophaga terrae (ex Kim and Jung 2007) TaxID=408074 RepID=A0A1H3YX58_9BACT|nr:hypothetical protein [Chitinophaga terrae (ex Kim and Jung 2007)]SEA15791.1 hypothetical protein SAMN05660909_01002 [Chitinophaga terrae (ex Kim and Jung 2007)]
MEQTMNFLKEVSAGTVKILNDFSEKGRKGDFTFEFDCATSDNYLETNILHFGQFVEMFNKLKTITGPVIYWIEVISDNEIKEILNAAETFKITNRRHVPAIRKKVSYHSRILYVGKVEKDIFVRVMTHMGFHRSHKTQGLQMYHWGKQIGLRVRFNLMQLHGGCESILPVLEKALAQKMQPIIGKHK